jgi:hypothetical protein
MSPTLFTDIVDIRNEIIKRYPTFISSLSTKIDYQAVYSASAYYVSFNLKESIDKYEIFIFIPTTKTIGFVHVSYVKKNGKIVNESEFHILNLSSVNNLINNTIKSVPSVTPVGPVASVISNPTQKLKNFGSNFIFDPLNLPSIPPEAPSLLF